MAGGMPQGVIDAMAANAPPPMPANATPPMPAGTGPAIIAPMPAAPVVPAVVPKPAAPVVPAVGPRPTAQPAVAPPSTVAPAPWKPTIVPGAVGGIIDLIGGGITADAAAKAAKAAAEKAANERHPTTAAQAAAGGQQAPIPGAKPPSGDNAQGGQTATGATPIAPKAPAGGGTSAPGGGSGGGAGATPPGAPPPAVPPPVAPPGGGANGSPYDVSGVRAGDILGLSEADIAAKQTAIAAAAAQTTAQQGFDDSARARAAGVKYDEGLAQSLGTDGADYARRATSSAEGGATDQALRASTASAQQVARAMKTGGMNAGEAALLGGQQIGDVYQQQYQSGLERGQSLYGQGAQMIGAAGSEQEARNQAGIGNQLAAGSLAAGIGKTQADQGTAKTKDFWATLAAAGGALLG